MAHWKLTLMYDGSAFHGWQVQPSQPTIQGTLADALARMTGETVLPQGSGRTDAGVHALGQVCSFSLDAAVPAANLFRALNRILPAAIRIRAVEEVPEGFHARHSARSKTYEYRIFDRCSDGPGGCSEERICSPFLAPFVWDTRWPLDLAAMQTSASRICGTHDFSSFAASDPDRSTREAEAEGSGCGGAVATAPVIATSGAVRSIFSSAWERSGELLVYRVTGSGFLHHMVRNLVGTFVDIGRGRLPAEAIGSILEARDRNAAGPTAPARGLFLVGVQYDGAGVREGAV